MIFSRRSLKGPKVKPDVFSLWNAVFLFNVPYYCDDLKIDILYLMCVTTWRIDSVSVVCLTERFVAPTSEQLV